MIFFFLLSEIQFAVFGGRRLDAPFICLSAGAVACESSCFAITLLHHTPLKVTSVLVLFVIFGGVF